MYECRMKKYSFIDEIYLECLRNGHYSPWVKKTRQLDLRGFTTAIAKVAMKIVLLAIFEGKLSIFNLSITVGDVRSGQVIVQRYFEFLYRRELLIFLSPQK